MKTLVVFFICAALCGCGTTKCPTCDAETATDFFGAQKVDEPYSDFEYGWNAAIDNTIHTITER